MFLSARANMKVGEWPAANAARPAPIPLFGADHTQCMHQTIFGHGRARHLSEGLIWRDNAGWGGMKWDGVVATGANDKAFQALKGD